MSARYTNLSEDYWNSYDNSGFETCNFLNLSLFHLEDSDTIFIDFTKEKGLTFKLQDCQCDTPNLRGLFLFLFFCYCPSLSQQRNLCRDRIPLSSLRLCRACIPVARTCLSCTPSFVMSDRASLSCAAECLSHVCYALSQQACRSHSVHFQSRHR